MLAGDADRDAGEGMALGRAHFAGQDARHQASGVQPSLTLVQVWIGAVGNHRVARGRHGG